MGDGIPLLALAGIAAFVVVVMWLVNRRRGDDNPLNVPTELFMFGPLLLVVGVVALVRLGQAVENTASFVAAIACLFLIAVDAYVSVKGRKDLQVIANTYGAQGHCCI